MPPLNTTAATFLLSTPTPLGPMVAESNERVLVRLDFKEPTPDEHHATSNASDLLLKLRDELARYFAGEHVVFRTPVEPVGTPFQQRVWRALREIPYGETRTYTQIAEAIGRPTACRAVAQANARNPISILVPCHRVIGADGSLTGYASGLDRKRWLLEGERGVKRKAPLPLRS